MRSFAFGTIDPQNFEVRATSTQAASLMASMGIIKLLQEKVQIWIAIGGMSTK
jgi:hypothetical protein